MTVPVLALYFFGGTALGSLYFASLWWNVRRFGRAGRVGTLLAGMAARFALLGIALSAASLQGALALLATVLGVLLARIVVVRGVRLVSP